MLSQDDRKICWQHITYVCISCRAQACLLSDVLQYFKDSHIEYVASRDALKDNNINSYFQVTNVCLI
jgi:hypothetical protein